MTTEQELRTAIARATDAAFDCGEWTSDNVDDDGQSQDYATVHAAYEAACATVDELIRKLFHGAPAPEASTDG